ncbi:uncharacterized protein METZ01_LOCUS433096, partial [marine metagenome]
MMFRNTPQLWYLVTTFFGSQRAAGAKHTTRGRVQWA